MRHFKTLGPTIGAYLNIGNFACLSMEHARII